MSHIRAKEAAERALKARTAEEKLDEIARAIAALAEGLAEFRAMAKRFDSQY